MDLSKLHPDHQQIMQSVLSDEFGVGYTEEQKQKIYDSYLVLNKIPKKDWGKQSTIESLNK